MAALKKRYQLMKNGNTHVTCHVGVPSCGQRHRNTLSYLINHLYHLQCNPQDIASPRLHTPRLSPFFLLSLTHPLPHHNLQVWTPLGE